MLSTGVLNEPAPLDNGDCEEYRKFLTGPQLASLRSAALSLLVQPLHQSFSDSPVTVTNWFDTQKDSLKLHNVNVGNWTVEVSKVKGQKIDLIFVLRHLSDKSQAALTLVRQNTYPLTSAEQIKFVTICRVLQLQNLVDANTHNLTLTGRAILNALTASVTTLSVRPTSPLSQNEVQEWREEYAECLWTVVELVRMQVLDNRPFSQSFDYFQQMNSHQILICRSLSLLSPYFKVNYYTLFI